MRHCTRRYLLSATIFLSFIILFSVPAMANLTHATMVPEQPEYPDHIYIYVYGAFGDGCWSVDPFQETVCEQTGPGQLRMTFQAVDTWEPGIVCPAVVVEYMVYGHFDPLEPDSYTLTIVEERTSLRDPNPDILVLEFDYLSDLTGISDDPDVSGTGPSFSTIKSLY